MATRVSFRGNIGATPEFKIVTKDGVEHKIVAMRVCDDTFAKDPATKKPVVTKSVWYEVSLFGDTAEHLAKVLQTGMRINVEGVLSAHAYLDKDGAAQVGLQVTADSISLHLTQRVESVNFSEKAALTAF